MSLLILSTLLIVLAVNSAYSFGHHGLNYNPHGYNMNGNNHSNYSNLRDYNISRNNHTNFSNLRDYNISRNNHSARSNPRDYNIGRNNHSTNSNPRDYNISRNNHSTFSNPRDYNISRNNLPNYSNPRDYNISQNNHSNYSNPRDYNISRNNLSNYSNPQDYNISRNNHSNYSNPRDYNISRNNHSNYSNPRDYNISRNNHSNYSNLRSYNIGRKTRTNNSHYYSNHRSYNMSRNNHSNYSNPYENRTYINPDANLIISGYGSNKSDSINSTYSNLNRSLNNSNPYEMYNNNSNLNYDKYNFSNADDNSTDNLVIGTCPGMKDFQLDTESRMSISQDVSFIQNKEPDTGNNNLVRIGYVAKLTCHNSQSLVDGFVSNTVRVQCTKYGLYKIEGSNDYRQLQHLPRKCTQTCPIFDAPQSSLVEYNSEPINRRYKNGTRGVVRCSEGFQLGNQTSVKSASILCINGTFEFMENRQFQCVSKTKTSRNVVDAESKLKDLLIERDAVEACILANIARRTNGRNVII